MSKTARRVIVAGGSLAGLMTALAVAEPGRTRVTVVERAPAGPREGGALGVDPRGLRRLLGAERAAVVEAGLGSGREGRAGLPTTWRSIHTGLRDLVDADPAIDVIDGTTVSAVGEDADGAWLRTLQGDLLRADAVVGADGHRSVVRAVVDPAHPDAAFARYSLWIGIAEERDLPAGSWPDGLDIRSSGRHYLLGYPLAAEDGSMIPGRRRLGWAWYDGTRNELLRRWGAVRGDVVQHSVRPVDVPGDVLAELRSEATALWPRPWRDAILDSVDRRAVTGTPIAEYVPDRLARGALVLVGDAAHVPTPMTGSGFATSVEDAIALGRRLREHSDVAAALAAYERDRLADARELVLSGQGFSRAFASAA